MKVNEKKRKLILVSATFALCITIMLSGTFAWSSISQTVINETMGEMLNPGGRLHDDFNGSNKDVYVENFTEGVDGMDIIVRIRLSEYMEIGPDAGINRDGENRNVTVLTKQDKDNDGTDDADAEIDSPSTWDIVTPMNDNHYGYWSWGLGGQTAYLPTLDTDTSSKSVDRNGTYEGDGTGTPFNDYHTYIAGNTYDGRTAKATIDGTVMNMDYWLVKNGMELGDYWVYDGDGWAYWANPLSAQEATGLLLDKISHSRTIADKWYYAINVECQMVTVDEIGTTENGEGFYSDEALTQPSSNARLLLDALIKEIGYVETEAGTFDMPTAVPTDEERQELLEPEESQKVEEPADTETEEKETETLTDEEQSEADTTVEDESEENKKTDTSKKDDETDASQETDNPPSTGAGDNNTTEDNSEDTADDPKDDTNDGTTGDPITDKKQEEENVVPGGETDEKDPTETTPTGENSEQTNVEPQTAI